ncbi:bifunctional tRNA (5-methylaminomethyl-2-thiouridine)(34)-methyltransferase MnmD/FAD-dependent 5-carboxymethylaminomethyl-2-thiouridine(34) oxidoreductase MnmC [Marinospirillum sp.]|uniref:bifunctional tRNA (5-methylaminomethyl-2-thiouridine)(34)-methyltransferase MnmD/FAD-dependent 5-carboxymethylaminomethyl-2-thiouridine(34) oxidoreductase MnmC n=1 Tax=Marinospirillum sp. TaxID=2183934 RepID=UPI003A880FA5
MSSPTAPSCLRPEHLTAPSLQWQNATPVSRRFDDVYFTRDQGLEEAEHVFLTHNHLPERWLNWSERRAFVVGETGFGTGLNFLLAQQKFLASAPATARLHWVSTELLPLTPADLEQAHSHWPQLCEEAKRLRDAYPLPISGFHRLQVHPRITLDLLLGDAATNLQQLHARVDAWCLDGFAPSKNPAMWTADLFAALARASHAQTTFATFTSAGLVKRGLIDAGFSIQKVPGFGRKREMLCGQYQGEVHPLTSQAAFSLPAPQSAQKIAVIGAGLAGLSTAFALTKKGCQVDIYEAEEVASGGSGNHQGVLYIKLAASNTPASRFYLTGLEFSRRWLEKRDPTQSLWRQCGVLQLAHSAEEAQRQARFLEAFHLPTELVRPVDAREASDLAETRIEHTGLFYPRAGWVRPQALCKQLAKLDHQMRVFTQHPIEQLEYDPINQGWQVTSGTKASFYDQVVLASGHAMTQLEQTAWLPIKPIRGQVTLLPTEGHPLSSPNTVVCGTGYITPPLDDLLSFGATFDLHQLDCDLREEDHLANLTMLDATLPDLLDMSDMDVGQLRGRAGLRCSTPDYLPLVGPAPQEQPWQQADPLGSGLTEPHHYPGLWINTGHGSRGLASIPLSAELLASQMLGDPLPIDTSLLEHLNPARFILRALKRRQKTASTSPD